MSIGGGAFGVSAHLAPADLVAGPRRRGRRACPSSRTRRRPDETGAPAWRVLVVMDHTTTFDTELGRCAVRWSETGITSVLLPLRDGRPDPTEPATSRTSCAARSTGMTAVLAGGADDLRDVPTRRPWRRPVPPRGLRRDPGHPAGHHASYGDIARAIGRIGPEAAREVGAALARNPTPIIVPCHRVVAADGKLTGFSAPGGLATKRRMLELEGAPGYGQQALFG